MPIFAHLRGSRAAPVLVCAVLAVLLRLAVLAGGWEENPLILRPALDGMVYLAWGTDIAQGDLAGTVDTGFVDSQPFFFNPLYAYLIAPFFAGIDLGEGVRHVTPPLEPYLGVLSPRVLALLIAQSLLGGATTALAAAAAGRYFGRLASWVAGIGVAFSQVLVHLDQHVAVSGLGAFLVAGAVYACAPDREGEEPPRRWWSGARGPLAKGLWLGLGALARPVSLIAMPLTAFLETRKPRPVAGQALRSGLLVAGAFLALAVPTLLRNGIVAGEWYLYTGAGGLNIYLGNNPVARQYRSMSVPLDKFAFNPITMHSDARRHVARETGNPEPAWGDVSSHFVDLTLEQVKMHPGASFGHYLNKARWFASPTEVPSSASLQNDRRFQPLLHLAFVPTWLLVALGFMGFWLHRKRLDVWQGPGALVLAHLAILTLVFPLSHYRSPAVPALAVLAAGAVSWGAARWKERKGAVLLAAGCAGVIAVIGAVSPGPAKLEPASALTLALAYRDMGRVEEPGSERQRELFALAREHALESLEAHRRETGKRGYAGAWLALGEMSYRQLQFARAAQELENGLRYAPPEWTMRLLRSCALQKIGNMEDAHKEAMRVLVNEKDQPQAVAHASKRLCEIFRALGNFQEAVRYEQAARAGGLTPDSNCEPR